MEYKPLGDYIRELDNRNSDLACSNLKGVSTGKELIKSKANTDGLSFAGYKLLNRRQFVYVADTSRRGDKMALAMCDEEQCIVSSIYTVFEVIDEEKLIPEYLLLWFKRKEFDRYARYHSWGSARETFDWGDMCNVELPVPPIEEQRKIVAFYSSHSKKIDLLQGQITALEEIKELSLQPHIPARDEYKPLGDYIRELDNRNSDLACSNLKGVSTGKELIKSKANTDGLSFAGYKLLNRRQFVYVADTSRRGDKMALAMCDEEQCIVSSIYTVFEVIDEEKLIPEYLLLWFKRKEFDRYARYHSWGSARETFDWGDMCNVELPVPPIEEQRKIVAVFKSYTEKKLQLDELLRIDARLPELLASKVILSN